jgi:Domain of unknown function (DUF3854)
MTAAAPGLDRLPPNWGGPLTQGDLEMLERSWITRELADLAMLRRVGAVEGREIVGQKGSRDCSGILIPYYWPGDPSPINYRIRRDHPDLVQGKDGVPKQDRKYLGSPGTGNRLYLPPAITLEDLSDVHTPAAIVEGEKKALAARRLANHECDRPRFIPIAIPGVWNWRGVVGKTGGPNGERLDVKGPIPDLNRIRWDRRTVYIIFDTNVHTNEAVKQACSGLARLLAQAGALVKFVTLPEECGVNGVDDLLANLGPEKVLELIDQATDGRRLHVVPSPQFEARPDGMYRVTQHGDQLRRTQLTNYRAAIVTNIRVDDGVETKREFEIEAELFGQPCRFTIPASEFARMDWPMERMGSGAITFPNQREYARAAIQSHSFTAEDRYVHIHTGWRKIDRRWVFLHAGGAIGENGTVPAVNVRLAGPLGRYELQLPANPDELREAVRCSLLLAQLGPMAVSFPLRAATSRAAFGDCDFSLHLAGETGVFKSELAALEQQHFGAGMDRLHLPGTWSSTANSLEVLAFHTKDALIVIDDFAPQGTAMEISHYHAAAARLFRAAGNRAARGRLDSTAKLREPKPPRGLVLSTGEEFPRGHSIRARMLILELSKGSIRPEKLSECQRYGAAGIYATSMGAFIQWIAPRFEERKAELVRRAVELRRTVTDPAHARTAEIIAHLQAGFEIYLAFALECGVIDTEDRRYRADQSWEALQMAAAAQAKHHLVTEPTARFLSLLQACLTSGRAHLQTTKGGTPERSPGSCGWRLDNQNWKSQGDCIGWVDGEDIYLEPAAAYRVIQMLARDMNEPFATSEQTWKKRLSEKGLLASVEATRETLTVRRTIAGSKISVLHILRNTLLPEAPDDENDDDR